MDLLNCPFCGGEAFVNFDELGDTNLAHVMCSKCWVSGPERDDGTEQLAWNTRTDLSQALIAAKLREAAAICWQAVKRRREQAKSSGDDRQISRWKAGAIQAEVLAQEIEALIPTDAQAALDAYVRKEVEKAIRACDPIIPSECGVSKEMKSLTPQLRHFFENHEKWVAAAIREAGHE